MSSHDIPSKTEDSYGNSRIHHLLTSVIDAPTHLIELFCIS